MCYGSTESLFPFVHKYQKLLHVDKIFQYVRQVVYAVKFYYCLQLLREIKFSALHIFARSSHYIDFFNYLININYLEVHKM